MDAIHLINDEQKGVFEQFREIFKNETLPDRSDVFLLRWLIARNFDLEEAEKMLRNSLLWRKLNRIDYLCNEFQPNEVISKYLPMGTVSCSEKFGEPTIMTSRLGLGDFRGIFESADPRDCLTHVTYALESAMMAKFPQSSGNSNDYTFNQIISIVNLTEFGMRFLGFKPALQWYHDVCKIYEENYPELIRKIFVINGLKCPISEWFHILQHKMAVIICAGVKFVVVQQQ